MRKNLPKLVKGYLIFGGIYMFFEFLIHFFNLKLSNVTSFWPQSAFTYASWMSIFYGSTCLFISLLSLYLQIDVNRNKQLIKLLAAYSAFHGSVLIFGSLTVKFDAIYHNFPSLSFWLPSYNGFLAFEAALLYGFAILVYFWQKS